MQRGSSPKLQVLNTALVTSQSRLSYASAKKDRDYWGRLVESAVGAHLLNGAEGSMVEIYYWRDRGHEVDFVLQSGERTVSLEVKSGRARSDYSGIDAFAKNFQPFRKLLVGGQGIPLEEFLATPISHWVD
jgi:predicted AAA+ superfamily ATPase